MVIFVREERRFGLYATREMNILQSRLLNSCHASLIDLRLWKNGSFALPEEGESICSTPRLAKLRYPRRTPLCRRRAL